jgi:hypothetical protein
MVSKEDEYYFCEKFDQNSMHIINCLTRSAVEKESILLTNKKFARAHAITSHSLTKIRSN